MNSKNAKTKMMQICGWKNTVDSEDQFIPTITQITEKTTEPKRPSKYRKEIGKQRRKNLSLNDGGSEKKNNLSKKKTSLRKMQDKPKKIISLYRMKETIIQCESIEPKFNNYKSLQGILLSKPQIRCSIKEESHSSNLKKVKQDTIAVLMMIKKEREEKLQNRFGGKPKNYKKITTLPKQTQNIDQKGKDTDSRLENCFPKSKPFKINKTMSQYFKKRENKKVDPYGKWFLI